MDKCAEKPHDNYRLFMSAEPAPAPEFHILPQGVLESSIKITNEPPTGMHANLHKALDNFSQETLEMSTKEAEFKSILFALCYFHAVVAERRKFAAQGWNRVYPFNFGDLTISVNVLYNYLEANTRVPWEDLRYLFGEIMYGGHITDDWDRRLCATYLEEYLQAELVDGDLMLAPGFTSPPNSDYVSYHQYIDDYLPPESPMLYGLHPNAEISSLTATSEKLFKTVFEMQPRDAMAGSGATVSRDEKVSGLALGPACPPALGVDATAVLVLAGEADAVRHPGAPPGGLQHGRDDGQGGGPHAVRHRGLPGVRAHEPAHGRAAADPDGPRPRPQGEPRGRRQPRPRRALVLTRCPLQGELTITPAMENLEQCLFIDKVPENWSAKAYPSMLTLSSWFADLQLRLKELENWTQDFIVRTLPCPSPLRSAPHRPLYALPRCADARVGVAGGLLQPAVLPHGHHAEHGQEERVAAGQDVPAVRRHQEGPRRLQVSWQGEGRGRGEVHCRKWRSDPTRTERHEFGADCSQAPREGANVHGLYMEGARWDVGAGCIVDSRHKELFPLMPVIYVRAITQDKQETRNVYQCPVYKTRQRGPTFVWTFNLKTRDKPTKWTLAGTALLLSI